MKFWEMREVHQKLLFLKNDVDVLVGNLQEDQLDINHDDIEFMIDSKYETEEEFNLKHATFTEIKLGNFSILHLNCGSLRANFSKICDLLQNMDQKFDVIAMSETWLNCKLKARWRGNALR